MTKENVMETTDGGAPNRLSLDLGDVRKLEIRYSRARPADIDLAVEYVGGRIRLFSVDRFLIERLLELVEGRENS
jgi:hypothetical protein